MAKNIPVIKSLLVVFFFFSSLGCREKVKRDLIQNLRTTVFGNFKISEPPGSLDFTLNGNVPQFHVIQREKCIFLK